MKRVREPIVAGAFYPGTGASLSETLDRLFEGMARPTTAALRSPVGLIVPHAGYLYSGAVAAAGFAELAAQGRPSSVLVLGANHAGMGRPLSLSRSGAWRTPLGEAPIATKLADRLLGNGIELAEEAFLREHSIEVELPFLQYLFGSEIPFVPLAVTLQPLDRLVAAGERIAGAVQGEGVAIVASSDFTHYQPQSVAEGIDRRAIEQIVGLDIPGFYRSLVQERLSICGGGAIVVLLAAAACLGIKCPRLVAYGTSGNVTGDRDAVVGYASILVSGGKS